MLIHYIKTAFKNVYHQKIYSFITILGLALGLAVSFFILSFVIHELSYDSFHRKKDRIFRLVSENKIHNWNLTHTPYPLADALVNDFPEIEKAARTLRLKGISVMKANEVVKEEQFFVADNSIFDILSFEFIQGNPNNALKNPGDIIISEYIAKKYFGKTNVTGQSISINFSGDLYEFTIRGVIENIPQNSTYKPEFLTRLDFMLENMDKILVSTDSLPKEKEHYTQSWEINFLTTYVLTTIKLSPKKAESNFRKLEEKYLKEPENVNYHLQNIQDIYFDSMNIHSQDNATGKIANVYIFSSIAFLVLLVACFNYIILSTAYSMTRTHEIGVRKVVGAFRSQLIFQILTESMLIVFLAIPFAIVLMEQFSPIVSDILGKEFTISYFTNWEFLLGIVVITILVGLISGSYLAFYMSRLHPVKVLKSSSDIKHSRSFFRQGLITFQFLLFIVLSISTIVIYRQLHYVQNHKLGFNKENILVIPMKGQKMKNNYNAFKNEILKSPDILSVSGAMWTPPTPGIMSINLPRVDEPENKVNVHGLFVAEDFVKTFGLTVIKGRDISKNNPDGLLINKQAIAHLGIDEPLGTELSFGKVIGVINDFHIHSYHEKIPPVIIGLKPHMIREIIIKTKGTNQVKTIEYIRKKWYDFAEKESFKFHFLDENFDNLYREERKLSKIMTVFTVLAILISLMGLFGLALFVARQKTKEIGIRKVLGASMLDILILLYRDYSKWIIIAFVFAVPIAWYIMHRWLQNFAYHTSISWWIFAIAGIATFFVALLTVSSHAIQAAQQNPARSLKDE